MDYQNQVKRTKSCTNLWQKKFKKPQQKKKLELKIKKLEEELKREQFKTLALNTMINIAERELKVDIRKKPGAKR